MKKDQLSELQLKSLIRVTSAVNSTLEIYELFNLILSETISTITHADGGILFLFDNFRNGLIAKASINYVKEELESVCLLPGESINGQCFLKKKSILLRTQEEIREAMYNISSENMKLFNRAVTSHHEGLAHRIISVPMTLSNNKCIGVLSINGFGYEGDFNDDDVRLLEAIAAQAVMAIEKATLYQNVYERNLELKQMVKFHREMSDTLMEMGHYHGILEKLADKISCSVTIATVNGEVLDARNNHTDYLDKPMEFPIRNSHELLGVLKIFKQTDCEFTPLQQFMIQQTCVFLALEIQREERLKEMEHRLKADLLDDIMDGAFSSELMQKAKALGFKTTGWFLAIVGEIDTVHTENIGAIDKYLDQYMLKREMTHWIKKKVDHYFPNSLVVNKNDQFIFLLSYPISSPVEELLKKSRLLSSNINSAMFDKHGMTISFGIGKAIGEFSRLHIALEEANKVIHYIRSSQQTNQIQEISSLGFQRLLVKSDGNEIKEFVRSILGELIDYDEKRRGDFVETLITYVSLSRQVGETAKKLHIHVNTLHYRLNRIEELLSVNLSDASQFLNIHLACALYKQIK